jgi:hypothetical protein
MDRCKESVLGNHPTAFAPSPQLVALLGAVAAGLPLAARKPLAFTAVIHKVGICEDDVQKFQFFYA